MLCRLCQIFERILYIWAIRHPASGYVQGINDLVTPFFVVFLSEYIENGTYEIRTKLSVWLVFIQSYVNSRMLKILDKK